MRLDPMSRFVCVTVLTACAADTTHAAPPAARALPPPAPVPVQPAPPTCIDDGAPYDAHILADRLRFFASPELDGRVPGSDGDLAARKLIVDRFTCLGLVPAGDDGGFEQA